MNRDSKAQPVFPLRLPLSTQIQAAAIAEREGLSLNQFITFAIAEKVVRLESLNSEPLDSDKA